MRKADLSAHLKLFTSLNRAPGPTWSEATRHRAPHKPLLLLAVLDLLHRGVITSPFIDVTGDLVELNELFKHALGAKLDEGLFRGHVGRGGRCNHCPEITEA